ncbi:MAG: energy coupling factor transporter S component ThiW [Bacillota bacterium]|jgi:energy coupling factor transporter S component ThiW|nr:energy coupling factor transporter S component ThiW [Bacillota bacterium]
MTTRKVTGLALLIAVGTAAGILVIPVPLVGAKVYPVQHAINVLSAVWFGPGPAVLAAFVIGLLRNLLGTGTLLAFPGGMAGALLAGLAYRIFSSEYAAAAGEIFGTGILGALLAFPLARYILGHEVMALAYIVPFALSSTAGACAAFVVLRIFSAAAKLSQQKKNKEL